MQEKANNLMGQYHPHPCKKMNVHDIEEYKN